MVYSISLTNKAILLGKTTAGKRNESESSTCVYSYPPPAAAATAMLIPHIISIIVLPKMEHILISVYEIKLRTDVNPEPTG